MAPAPPWSEGAAIVIVVPHLTRKNPGCRNVVAAEIEITVITKLNINESEYERLNPSGTVNIYVNITVVINTAGIKVIQKNFLF